MSVADESRENSKLKGASTATSVPMFRSRDERIAAGKVIRDSVPRQVMPVGNRQRTAQQAMRHSEIGLTMNVYTDPRLLDVADAIDSLPDLPLDAIPKELQEFAATGTDPARSVAPTVAPTAVHSATELSIPDNSAADGDVIGSEKNPAKQHVSTGFSSVGATGRRLNFF